MALKSSPPRGPRLLLAVAISLSLAACGGAVKKDAAGDVRAFLQAAEKDDAKALEAHLDRKALRADLKTQLLESPDVRALHAQLGDVGDVAVDRMIAPQALALARGGPLLSLSGDSRQADVARALKKLDSGRVCLLDPGVRDLCLLTFAKRGKAWKLVALHAADLGVQLADPSITPANVAPVEDAAD
ncbi:MAG: DUF2939 domain-containing protein [Phenylobacterium sp.]|uniref:DUF2939 domain-containing protein n=1 Tax=Phenylobacterium sp. TaxID=1871053 RepID=UPI0027360FEB|nr:DUF2939 domain-containing protein [Phenylobacterium sp.]MDP3173289.1 DUF2939 domain-containing protein [Phenylobacterium sp.]